MDSDDLTPKKKKDLWKRFASAACQEVAQFRKKRRNLHLPRPTFDPATNGFQISRSRYDTLNEELSAISYRKEAPEPKKSLLMAWTEADQIVIKIGGVANKYRFDVPKGFRSVKGNRKLSPEELVTEMITPFLLDET